MPSEAKIQILLADNHEMVRHGVKALLVGTEIKIVAEATTVKATVKLAMEKEVDLVLLDIQFPDGDGLTALGRIKLDRPELPVLLFTAFDNPANVAKAIALGANGFLLKGCDRDEFLTTIRTVAAGESTWNKEMLRRASRSLRNSPPGGNLEVFLTDIEREVLGHVTQGLTNKQIAAAMESNEMTIREHIKQILRKLGVVDRTQAALWAVRNNMV